MHQRIILAILALASASLFAESEQLPSFTADIVDGDASVCVTFTADLVGAGVYIWDFGDGVVDATSGEVATHVYDKAGTYDVSLCIDGTLMIVQEKLVRVGDSVCVSSDPSQAQDMSLVIQEALDGTGVGKLGGLPGTVRLGPGMFRCESEIRLASGQNLAGTVPKPGLWYVAPYDGTVINFVPQNSSGDQVLISIGDGADGEDTRWNTVRDLAIGYNAGSVATSSGQVSAIRLDTVWHAVLENLQIDGFHASPHAGPARTLSGPIGTGLLARNSLFVVVRNCRFKDADVMLWLDECNATIVDGGSFQGLPETNSHIVIEGGNGNTVRSASVEGHFSFAMFELFSKQVPLGTKGASHNSFIGNRLEVDDGIDASMGTARWHFSIDENSVNNSILSMPFSDAGADGVGPVHIDNPPGAATARRVVGARSVGDVRLRPGSAAVGARSEWLLAIPEDWVGDEIDVRVLFTGEAGASGDVQLRIRAELVDLGEDPDDLPATGATCVVSGAGAGLAECAASFDLTGELGPASRYLSVVVDRVEPPDSGAPAVTVRDVQIEYGSTTARFLRPG